MIKYFCDVCGIEVSNPAMSLDMTGKVLCGEHYREDQEYIKSYHWVYMKAWDKDRFVFPKGIRKVKIP